MNTKILAYLTLAVMVAIGILSALTMPTLGYIPAAIAGLVGFLILRYGLYVFDEAPLSHSGVDIAYYIGLMLSISIFMGDDTGTFPSLNWGWYGFIPAVICLGCIGAALRITTGIKAFDAHFDWCAAALPFLVYELTKAQSLAENASWENIILYALGAIFIGYCLYKIHTDPQQKFGDSAPTA